MRIYFFPYVDPTKKNVYFHALDLISLFYDKGYGLRVSHYKNI